MITQINPTFLKEKFNILQAELYGHIYSEAYTILMNIYIANIEEETLKNQYYRKVEYTTHNSQLVFMTLKPGEEIGNEIHGVDQFIRIESGSAQSILNNGEETKLLTKNMAIIIPAGTWHNIENKGTDVVKLYTIYSGPSHLKDTLQPTKSDEVEDSWDGKTNLH